MTATISATAAQCCYPPGYMSRSSARIRFSRRNRRRAAANTVLGHRPRQPRLADESPRVEDSSASSAFLERDEAVKIGLTRQAPTAMPARPMRRTIS
jgi:hypothetical protein